MKVQKFNYVRFFIFIFTLIALIVGIVILIKHINYTKTYEYKFLNLGYNEEEIKVLENKLNDKEKEKLLKKKYNELYIEFINEKFFLFDNMDKYIEYKNENDDVENSKIVAIINTEANIDWFDNERDADTSKGILVLVNRLYGLSSDYEVDDVVDVPIKYAYDGMKLSNKLIDDLIRLCDEASEEGYTFVVSEGIRTYKDQAALYDEYANAYGKSDADLYVARPGHSEYETGLSFDLVPYNKYYKDPKSSEEYTWLRENAHRFGFIFRFESDRRFNWIFRRYMEVKICWRRCSNLY